MQTGASGPVRGDCSLLCARDGAPDCTRTRKSTMAMMILDTFVQSSEDFLVAVNELARCDPCLSGRGQDEMMKDRRSSGPDRVHSESTWHAQMC
jgi:hypothetical protein|eukprot:1953919-Prymnesium_polylepis.1